MKQTISPEERTSRENRVKRFLIFLLLGPVIGFAAYVVWQISLGRSIGGIQGLLLGLPFVFIFALLPSMVM